jgi:thiol-disulfide isomerase/thioredoxin
MGEKGTLVMFICKHCPYVIHVQDEIAAIAKDYKPKGIGFVAISSNDIENYPDDAPGFMKQQAEEVGFIFPYLYDESQEVARNYDAACTPDFYLFDSNHILVYRGRLDESRPGNNIEVTGKDLRMALDKVLKGEQVPEHQYPSMGCNIKWKK